MTPDSTAPQKILVQHVLNAALIDQTVPAPVAVTTHGRVTGQQLKPVPVSFTGTLRDGMVVPQESAETIQGLLSQTLVQNKILPEGAFTVVVKEPKDMTESERKALLRSPKPQVRLSVDVPDYAQVDTKQALAYLDKRAEDKDLSPSGAHHAKVLRTAGTGVMSV